MAQLFCCIVLPCFATPFHFAWFWLWFWSCAPLWAGGWNHRAGLDKQLRRYDLVSGSSVIVGAHAEAIKSVVCSQKHGVVVTGSWDKTIKVWRVADLQCIGEYPQPDKVYTMSLAGDRVVVGMVRWSRCRCCFSFCFSCCCCCAQEQHSMERERERQTKPTYACTCSSCSFDAVLQAGRHVWVWNLNDMVCHCAHMKEGRRRTRRIRRTRRKERERERERERDARAVN